MLRSLLMFQINQREIIKISKARETIKPVFDCLFWADSYIVSQKLSIEGLTKKYAYDHIVQRSIELSLRSRGKLGKPHFGFLKSFSDLKNSLKWNTQSQKPLLVKDIYKKRKRVNAAKEKDMKFEEKLVNNEDKVKKIEEKLQEETQEISEIYDEMSMVRFNVIIL